MQSNTLRLRPGAAAGPPPSRRGRSCRDHDHFDRDRSDRRFTGAPSCPGGNLLRGALRPRVAIVVLTGALLGGCIGRIGGSTSEVDPDGPGAQSEACRATADPIRRLTQVEYRNTIEALLPGIPLPAELPIADERSDGFVGQPSGQAASALGVRRYQEAAEQVARAAAADLPSWAPCSDDTAQCLRDIALGLAPRAYRRPLDDVEREALSALAVAAHGELGMQPAVVAVVQALLESPWFLYRPEIGNGEQGAVVPLDDWEMASRLSYFFLDTMPDDTLFAAAEAGALQTAAGVEAEARRLLADERARQTLRGFFAEWLRLWKLGDLELDAERFPELDDALRADMMRSAELYLDHAIWRDDGWTSLMTGSHGFVNDRLAPLFGVPAPGSEELVAVDLDPAQRRGALTQPAFLAATSHGIGHSPIYRGVTMLSSILCHQVPPPPPGAIDAEPQGDSGEVCTTRDRVEKSHDASSQCQGCHQAIDGAGFTFEHYDALGRHRTEENGCAIDASGDFPGTLGKVSDAVDAAARLEGSDVARSCMARHLFRYAAGRHEAEGDSCHLDGMVAALDRSGGNFQEVVVSLVLSPAFRSRPSE